MLPRVAALESGRDGVRVNVVHPDGVFDTDEESCSRNVLSAEVTAAHVAAAVVALCGPAFVRTTGAQIGVDGGNDRVI